LVAGSWYEWSARECGGAENGEGAAARELGVKDVPGGQPVITFGFEQVEGDDAVRLRGGDEVRSGRDRRAGVIPASIQAHLMVTLERTLRDGDGINGEVFHRCRP